MFKNLFSKQEATFMKDINGMRYQNLVDCVIDKALSIQESIHRGSYLNESQLISDIAVLYDFPEKFLDQNTIDQIFSQVASI